MEEAKGENKKERVAIRERENTQREGGLRGTNSPFILSLLFFFFLGLDPFKLLS